MTHTPMFIGDCHGPFGPRNDERHGTTFLSLVDDGACGVHHCEVSHIPWQSPTFPNLLVPLRIDVKRKC